MNPHQHIWYKYEINILAGRLEVAVLLAYGTHPEHTSIIPGHFGVTACYSLAILHSSRLQSDSPILSLPSRTQNHNITQPFPQTYASTHGTDIV